MKLKKNHYLLFIILHFFTSASAQFTGYYNLHDGGVDMPSSSLFVLPNNDFLLFYYDGFKSGNWSEIDKNNIALTEIKKETTPIRMYGRHNKNLDGITVDVYGLAKTHAFINFSTDTISKKEFQPIFNDWANCLSGDYKINKQYGDNKWVTISYPIEPGFGTNSIRYPYKAMTYTFPLDHEYNEYIVLQHDDALRESIFFTISKKDETYYINGNQKLEHEELTTEILNKVDDAKKAIHQESITIKEKFGTNISVASIEEMAVYKPMLKPIFVAQCDGDESEQADEQEDYLKLLPAADRVNGFYKVVNFKENEYDVEKYELAKEASIKRDDILSVNKIISNYGGYEIEIIFTEKGREKFAELSRNNIRKPIAIVVNKLIISSPVFASEITGGKANIAGSFSEAEVDAIIANFKKLNNWEE